jgi:hypothetical protein
VRPVENSEEELAIVTGEEGGEATDPQLTTVPSVVKNLPPFPV